MHGSYSLQIIPPESPASVGDYRLRVEADGRYELVVRVLANDPIARDWRAEWNAVEGRVTREGDALTFTVTRGQRQVRSCAWAGRGVEDDYHPMDSFRGQLTASGITIEYFGELALKTCPDEPLVRGLIIPDYLFA